MSNRSKNEEIIKRISEETDYRPETIRKIIKHFFLGVRKIMLKNGEINIKGAFLLTLKPFYKKKVLENPDINLRKREFPTKKKKK